MFKLDIKTASQDIDYKPEETEVSDASRILKRKMGSNTGSEGVEEVKELNSHPLRQDVAATSQEYESSRDYLVGARLRLTTITLCIFLFLTNLEIPIVSTALVGITEQLGGYNKASWIITAYLLGYVGVLIIFSKLSDIFGRKSILVVVVLDFIIFSGACGAAQSIDQLIIFRAFQGIGGAGNYALCSVILIELVPSHKYAKYTSAISVVYSLSLLLGPILGGIITQDTTWRWIFLLNVPVAAFALLIVLFSLPNGYPNHKESQRVLKTSQHSYWHQSVQRLDWPGTALLLISTITLVVAFEEGGIRFPWRSAFVIVLLIVSGFGWIAFFAWERRVTLRNGEREPVFPWRLARSRIWIGMSLNALFLGAPWFCTIFQIPQRFQIVNSLSPFEAGVRFIPFTLAAPVGSVIAPTIAKLAKVPPIYLVLFAAILQVVGLVLISTLPNSLEILPAQYGYEIIAGFGCGINITLLVLMTPFCVQERDKAVAMGSVAQFRVMGGAIGLAIITTAFNGLVRSQLENALSPAQVQNLLQNPSTISLLPIEMQSIARSAFGNGYSLQVKILSGLAAGQIPATLLMWQKEQILV